MWRAITLAISSVGRILRPIDRGAWHGHIRQLTGLNGGADGLGEQAFKVKSDIAGIWHGTYRVGGQA